MVLKCMIQQVMEFKKGKVIVMKKDLRTFVKHCMEDSEFWVSGGIPTKEEFYIKKLGLSEEQLAVFYDAMVSLQQLSKEIQKGE